MVCIFKTIHDSPVSEALDHYLLSLPQLSPDHPLLLLLTCPVLLPAPTPLPGPADRVMVVVQVIAEASMNFGGDDYRVMSLAGLFLEAMLSEVLVVI